MWWTTFLGAAALIAMTPGTNNLLGLHHGVHHGFGRALPALTGRLAAFTLMIAAVVAGLGPLLAASELALTILKWVGVAYLLVVGVRIVVRTFREPVVADPGEPVAGSLVRREFLVAITNPKAVLIFTAFVPQFVDPALGPVPVQLAVLGGLYLLAEAVAGSVWIAAGALLGASRMSRATQRRVDRGTGGVLIGLAGALALSKA